jgi:predicted nucleic acid-binding protein
MAPVLCNASPLLALGKLNRLDLLAGLFDRVEIPRAVYDEVVTQGLARGAPDALTVSQPAPISGSQPDSATKSWLHFAGPRHRSTVDIQ